MSQHPDDVLILSSDLAIAVRTTGHARYDFPFRQLLPVSSAWRPESCPPVAFRLGTIDDYPALLQRYRDLGFTPLLSDAEHRLAAELPH